MRSWLWGMGLALGGAWLLWPGCQQKQLKPSERSLPRPTDGTLRPDLGARPEPRPTEPRPRDQSTGLSGTWGKWSPIDIHAHIGTFSGYDLSTPTLMAGIQAYGIRWALISNIDGANLSSTRNLGEDQANQATVDTVKKYPHRLRGIYWTRPNRGLSAKAESFLQQKLAGGRIFVAMKFHPDMNQFPADSPKLDPYMKLCQKYKLAAVFHSGSKGSPSGPQKIYALARRYPKVPVVLYHMGFFGPHNDAIHAAASAKKNKDARLYLGTAQADPKAVVQAVKSLGSAYILFGTDAAYFGKEHYKRYIPQIQALQSSLPARDFANVIRNNARTLFGLP